MSVPSGSPLCGETWNESKFWFCAFCIPKGIPHCNKISLGKNDQPGWGAPSELDATQAPINNLLDVRTLQIALEQGQIWQHGLSMSSSPKCCLQVPSAPMLLSILKTYSMERWSQSIGGWHWATGRLTLPAVSMSSCETSCANEKLLLQHN